MYCALSSAEFSARRAVGGVGGGGGGTNGCGVGAGGWGVVLAAPQLV